MATDDADGSAMDVLPLENTAYFDIDTRQGYVRVDQSWGDQTLYTPEEARDIAAAIEAAADEAQNGE
ncbi:hypothetical protein BRD17_08715 [Halobacteriales archaeon SW_7_68_16]|nr:MAG: hypothetical protein BRD17_08715 [Halobacteriales archaeon SW_7_68_16]